jgi:hypothetical protein
VGVIRVKLHDLAHTLGYNVRDSDSEWGLLNPDVAKIRVKVSRYASSRNNNSDANQNCVLESPKRLSHTLYPTEPRNVLDDSTSTATNFPDGGATKASAK